MSSHDARRRLIEDARYEVVPLKSLNDQIPHLPARVLGLSDLFTDEGHRADP